ncbi:MAG: hypothetical protein HY012_07135 [Acidobacteria bacterium]|nr:hypothetical protein [Acidobacteriota bacterium]
MAARLVPVTGVQFMRNIPPYCVNDVPGSRPSTSAVEGRPKKRVTAACESRPWPTSSPFERRPATLASTPNFLAAYDAVRFVPKPASALLKNVLVRAWNAGAPAESAGARVRNCTLPPSASLPYCALLGPRKISTASRFAASTRSINVLMPPRIALVE